MLIFFVGAETNSSQSHCEVRCTDKGVEIVPAEKLKKFLLCCDFVDCISERADNIKELLLPEHARNSTYACELICNDDEDKAANIICNPNSEHQTNNPFNLLPV